MANETGEPIMLNGQHILLGPLERGDLDRTRAWANDPELMARILRTNPVTADDQQRWYEELLANPGKRVFAIRTLPEGRHVGNTGLYHIDPVHRRAELWILIGDREYWGRGIGREAVSLLARFAFEGLNLNRIYLHVAAGNAPAIRVYEKCGFRHEGLLRQHVFIQGRYLDVCVMSLLRGDLDDDAGQHNR